MFCPALLRDRRSGVSPLPRRYVPLLEGVVLTLTTGTTRHPGLHSAVRAHTARLDAETAPTALADASTSAPGHLVTPDELMESEDLMLEEILGLVSTLRHKTRLHATFHTTGTLSPDERAANFEALTWIHDTLDDVAATAAGISRGRRTGALGS